MITKKLKINLAFFVLYCVVFSGNAFGETSILDIAGKYVTDTENSIYIQPNINQEKLENFLNMMRRKFNINIKGEDVIVYFDETLFGSGKSGVALTNDELICNVSLGFKGSLKLKKINSVTIDGFLNKTIEIDTGSKKKISIELTQGNQGAETIVDILQEYIVEK